MSSRRRNLTVEVAVVSPLLTTLSYLPPENGQRPGIGQRVLVPLGARLVTGYILDPEQSPPEERKLKKIHTIEAESPLFPANMVPFFRFISDYYQFPIGEVLRTAMPAGLSRRSQKTLVLKAGAEIAPPTGTTSPWIEKLRHTGKLAAKETAALMARAETRREIERLCAAGVAEIITKISGSGSLQRRMYVKLTDATTAVSLSRPESRVLELLRGGSESEGMARADLSRRYSGAATGIKRLADRGLVELYPKTVFRDPLLGGDLNFPEPEHLTLDQKRVMERLGPAIKSKKFSPFLLHGVTGSGKTEIYLQATAICLAADRDAIILVPEIALASQIEAHFVSRFGDRVALLHSGLTRAEHLGQWQRIKSGAARVAIGARSAVFAPMADPGLIIIDEEHDSAYKQEDGLRYNGRDLAIFRASRNHATVIMGSATPAVTTFHKAGTGKFTILKLPRRISPHPLPQVTIVDMKKVLTVSGRPPILTPQLRDELKENLNRGEQSLIFLNRRGYANMVVCRDCGEVVGCKNCKISLTLHRNAATLLCHHCGFRLPEKLICGKCASPRLVPVGFGTEKIEAELVRLFPKARISRLDHDAAADRNQFFKILNQVHAGEIDILIGTQMITKGHDFPRVTLVGVVCADTGLGVPDYKAGERTFQLLTQVAGRAGRGGIAGRVLVQTLQPEHYAVTCARDHDYPTMYDRELGLRKKLAFPPFGYLVSLRCEAEDEKQTRQAATALAAAATKLSRGKGIQLLGPAPAPLSRLQKRYRWHMLLKGNNRKALQQLCRRLRRDPPRECRRARIKVIVDVDPENML